jgi:hypothetical protein
MTLGPSPSSSTPAIALHPRLAHPHHRQSTRHRLPFTLPCFTSASYHSPRLDQIARDRCEYYSGKGESPGWWVGTLAERTGLTGVAEDEAVQRLFAGQDPLTGEQRVAPLWRSDPRSRLDAGPLQAALRELAASRGVDVSELATGERLRNQLQHISGSRKVSAVVVERLCRSVLDRNPEELYGDAYAEARKHVGKRIDARVASFDLLICRFRIQKRKPALTSVRGCGT